MFTVGHDFIDVASWLRIPLGTPDHGAPSRNIKDLWARRDAEKAPLAPVHPRFAHGSRTVGRPFTALERYLSMPNVRDVIDYLLGVFWTWFGLLGGVAMGLLGLYERLAKKPLSKLAYASVLVGLLLVSPFFLWRGQKRTAEGLRARAQALRADSLAQTLANDSLRAEIARGPRLASDAAAARDRATLERLGAFFKEGTADLAALVQPGGVDPDGAYRKALAWTPKVQRYLQTCEDKTYESEFMGAVEPRFGGLADVPDAMRMRLQKLQKFIDGLREKRR
jgi:hypothetical protein